MLPRWWRRRFAMPPPPRERPLQDEARQGGVRFLSWAMGRGVDGEAVELLDRALESLKPAESAGEELVADAAAFLGEQVRATHGGAWGEDPLLGVVLRGVGGLPLARLRPLEAVELKLRDPGGMALGAFVAKLPERLAVEELHRDYLSRSEPREPAFLAERLDPATMAQAQAAAFRMFCQGRLGADLPPTLVAVQELDRWLRTHYLLCTVREETLWQAGFFLGEVMRGLFGGAWRLDAPRPDGVALAWPEIALYPVGRVFKMLQECPTVEPLDEYARMVPAARRVAKADRTERT